MTDKSFKIRGMHCASCAAIIEKELKKVEGVNSIEVNYGTEAAKVSYDEAKTNPEHLSEKIKPLGYSLIVPKNQPSHGGHGAGMSAASMGMSEDEHAAHLGLNQSKEEKLDELADMRWKVISAVPLTVFSAFVLGWETFAQFGSVPTMSLVWEEFFHHILPLMATYMLFVVGKPYLLGVYRFCRSFLAVRFGAISFSPKLIKELRTPENLNSKISAAGVPSGISPDLIPMSLT